MSNKRPYKKIINKELSDVLLAKVYGFYSAISSLEDGKYILKKKGDAFSIDTDRLN